MEKKIIEQFKKLEKEIKNAKKVLLLGHRAPDGDAIGGLLSLNSYLKSLRKETYIFSSQPPKYLDFLPEYKDIKKKKPKKNDFDLILALDYADERRIDISANFSIDKNKVISIDHHISGKRTGKIKIVSASASSVCEMIYYFLKMAGIKINKEIANYLLVGIFTDTVGFTRLPEREDIKEVIVDLIKKGANLKKITSSYHHISYLQSKVLERFLSRAKWDKKLNIIYSWISYEDFSELRERIYKKKKPSELFLQEPPVFPDFLARVGEADVYVFLVKLKKEKIKVSLRSSSEIDVAKISEIWGGGGHKEAAGFFTKGTVKEVMHLLKNELKKQKK